MPSFYLVFVSLTLFLNHGHAYETFPLLMPDVRPTSKDAYLCTAFRMPTDDYKYIVGFKPNATMATAHHIIIYGCTEPGFWERDAPRSVWSCGNMAGGQENDKYSTAPVCQQGNQIIYAWAKDAPPLSLPDGVGFKVGADSRISFLVLQIHYANVDKFLAGGTDNSGIILSMQPRNGNSINKRAGVYLLGTGGFIPPNSITHMETACMMEEKVTIYPFAFRTHTHKLGKVVTGYVIKPDGVWHMIGKHDPQKPQMFYPTEKGIEVDPEDVLTARCTMNNSRNETVYIGSTAGDEMCNFYIMYYVNGENILDKKDCFSMGPPFYSWKSDKETVGRVPAWVDKDASSLNYQDPEPR